MARSQISAEILPETKEALEHFSKTHGVRKGFVIEAALQHHLQALQALPPDVIIPPVLVVSARTAESLAQALLQAPEPTAAMQALFDDDAD